jgi:thymidylate synthase ThyX
MKHPRRIYLLSPKDLNPETIAVTFAKTSRSPKPFDEIASELSDESASKFHEKWVVGYGHASVAEHAVLHLAMENVSRLAIETIEGNRLASYTEKSTRYQQWHQSAYYLPAELEGHPLQADYLSTCQHLFETYQDCISRVTAWLKSEYPREGSESEKAFQRRIKNEAVDSCRFLLPAASLANVGVTINARALEYAICKMLSSPLAEVRGIGEELRSVGQGETPTLIKYAQCNEYLISARKKMSQTAQKIAAKNSSKDFDLIAFDKNGEDHILAAILYRFQDKVSYSDCLEFIRALSFVEKKSLVEELMGDRGRFDQPLREFEYADMSFDVLMDQGAYFEFKRHRMMTQTTLPLTSEFGFAVPKVMRESKCEKIYVNAMRKADQTYQKMAEWNPDVASYIIPNGFNRRVLFKMNLREAYHFCRLRAAENAHYSIRRVAQSVAETIQEIYPLLGAYLDIPGDQSTQEITSQYFSHLKTF